MSAEFPRLDRTFRGKMPLRAASATAVRGGVQVKRMWPGGPLRQWSDTPVKLNSWNRYETDSCRGFAGSYICDDCQEAVVGVYRQKRGKKLVCAACKEAVRP